MNTLPMMKVIATLAATMSLASAAELNYPPAALCNAPAPVTKASIGGLSYFEWDVIVERRELWRFDKSYGPYMTTRPFPVEAQGPFEFGTGGDSSHANDFYAQPNTCIGWERANRAKSQHASTTLNRYIECVDGESYGYPEAKVMITEFTSSSFTGRGRDSNYAYVGITRSLARSFSPMPHGMVCR